MGIWRRTRRFRNLWEWPWNLADDLQKQYGTFYVLHQALCFHFVANSQFKLKSQSGKSQFRWNRPFFVPCDLEIWLMTLKTIRAPLLYIFNFCASFLSHQTIITGVIVQKRPIRVKVSNFLSCVTLKFHGWPWKTIEHLFYATSSFVHHFTTISEFKLELQSGKPNLGENKIASSKRKLGCASAMLLL